MNVETYNTMANATTATESKAMGEAKAFDGYTSLPAYMESDESLYIDRVEVGAASLDTAITDTANLLGDTGKLDLFGRTTDATAQIDAAATDLKTALEAECTHIGGSTTVLKSGLQTQITRIEAGQAVLSDAIQTVETLLTHYTGDDLKTLVTAALADTGGVDETAYADRVEVGAASLDTAITDTANLLGDTGKLDLFGRTTDATAQIDAAATDLKTALEAECTHIGGSTTVLKSGLQTQITRIEAGQAVLSDAIQTVETLLTHYTGDDLKTLVTAALADTGGVDETAYADRVEVGAASLDTAITDTANLLGDTGKLDLFGRTTDATAQIDAAATDLKTALEAECTHIGGSTTVLKSGLQTQITRIEAGQAVLSDAIQTVETLLTHYTGDDLKTLVTAALADTGGVDETAYADRVEVGAASLDTAITDTANLLGDTGKLDLFGRTTDATAQIDAAATDLKTALEAECTHIGGSTTVLKSGLQTQITRIEAGQAVLSDAIQTVETLLTHYTGDDLKTLVTAALADTGGVDETAYADRVEVGAASLDTAITDTANLLGDTGKLDLFGRTTDAAVLVNASQATLKAGIDEVMSMLNGFTGDDIKTRVQSLLNATPGDIAQWEINQVQSNAASHQDAVDAVIKVLGDPPGTQYIIYDKAAKILEVTGGQNIWDGVKTQSF
ncbi:MAG: hypothetical protein ACPGUZ_02080 [Holosporaceae bacterium]